MIGVLTMFGEINLQPVLKKLFMNDDLIFITENSNTSVQLLDRVSKHYKESDVIIMAAAAMNMEKLSDTVNEIRKLDAKMRIVLILNGNSTQYDQSEISEYENLKIDIIFDDNGFDTKLLIDTVKKGRLSRKEAKEINNEAREREFKLIPSLKETNDRKDTPSNRKQLKFSKILEPKHKPKDSSAIAVFNVSRGSGATTAVVNIAQYFTLKGYDTKLVDLSGTDALKLVKIKGVEIGIGNKYLSKFKRASDVLIIDFGTPYDITPKGDKFKVSFGYNPKYLRKIRKCNIKVIMGFSDVWNVGKIRFFLNNDLWEEIIDDSYIFLTSGDCERLKSIYPEVNIMCRDDNYIKEILNILKEEK